MLIHHLFLAINQSSLEQSSSILVMHNSRYHDDIYTSWHEMDQETHQKEAIFKELYSLDESESDGEVCPLRVFRKSVKVSINKEHRCPTPLGRTQSAPAQSTVSNSLKNINATVKTSPKATKVESGNTMPSTAISKGMSPNKSFPAANASKHAPKAGKKRKRGQSVEVVPASQRIFADCTFCKVEPRYHVEDPNSKFLVFIPNNDVAPARRLRIRRAMERGAIWVREWREGISHIILDRGLCYNDVMSFLKISALPVRILSHNLGIDVVSKAHSSQIRF